MKWAVGKMKKEHGNAVVLMAFAMSVLLGFAALAVDTGVLYLDHTRLARAADAAALAGAGELPDVGKAAALAAGYAEKNGIDTSDPAKFKVSFSEDAKKITVEIKKDVGLFFAGSLGFNNSMVNGRATAKISPLKAVTGLVPIGLDEGLMPLVPGQQYVIKVGYPELGWTGVLAYPGQSGSDDYRQSARYGYQGKVTIGDNEAKGAGNKTGPTIQGLQERIDAAVGDTWNNHQPDSPRILYVPIYRVLGSSPSDNVKIVGFASVFLDSIGGTGNKNDVYVTYVNHSASGETDDSLANPYLFGVKLVE